jgi:DNA primase
MAGRVKQSDIEELKARANLVDIISGYVSLKPASAGSFKGLCPFHGEKSPSFNVRNSPPFYHCFGCGVGGDVFKFLQEIESITFADAVERLADKLGYQLSYEEGSSESSARTRLLAANSAAAEFYQSQLNTEEGAFARNFLIGRGFDDSAQLRFGIGYAPKGWQNLLEHLTGLGFTSEELITAGLVMASDKGGYDRFRGRVLWPIKDANSQVLGFGARKLYEDDQGPKYLNTPETPVYHKGSVLYGLDSARKAIVKSREIVVVEGYTDVMACHLAGVDTAVATCGTAFGEDHIKLINRLFGSSSGDPASVIFTFDPDAAGEKAALRMYSDTSKFNALTYVAAGPEGLDPSDLRQQRGDEAIKLMVQARKPLFEFVIRHRIAKFDLGNLESRVAAARAAAGVISELVDPALRSAYTRQLAEWVSLDVSEVNSIVSGVSRQGVTERVAPIAKTSVAAPRADNPQARQERQILEILIQKPGFFQKLEVRRISAAGFVTPGYQRLLQGIARNADSMGEPDWVSILMQSEPEYVDDIRSLAMAELPVRNQMELERYAKGIVKSALMQALLREKNDLLAALKRIDADGQPEAANALQQELMKLELERRSLM